MHSMFCNITKSHALPLAGSFSSKPTCLKSFHALKHKTLPNGCSLKPSQNPILINFTSPSYGFGHRTHGNCDSLKSNKFSIEFHCKASENCNRAKPRSVSTGFCHRLVTRNCFLARTRSFSSLGSQKIGEDSSVLRAGKTLPWLASQRNEEAKGLEKATVSKSSHWLEKATVSKSSHSSWKDVAGRLKKDRTVKPIRSSWEESVKRLGQGTTSKDSVSSWEKPAKNFVQRSSSSTEKSKQSKNNLVIVAENLQHGYVEKEESDEEVEKEEADIVDDPRWDKIKYRYNSIVNSKVGSERPELRRWNKQENWGKRTWKEATESTVPKMAGEGIYGVGPVLAALSSGRREFYALYVQEGLDLSGNNRKKKDKKGVEKVLRIAEKVGLSIKEVSKHDLNMVVDNRPHQGLVLDASPLEMVKIKELDPVLTEEEKGSLWVALDEVTDPQNLGAIIRSAYFFGAAGVVLCAKNSAPLSGVVSKASAGSLELMELRYCKNMMQFLASSAENGWRVLGGSVSSRAIPLNEVLPGAPTILVLGSEGTGLRPLVERSCTQLIRIPGNIPVDVTAGGVEDGKAMEMDYEHSGREFQSFLAVESLNVSVAAGVLLHHLIGNYSNSYNLDDKQNNAVE